MRRRSADPIMFGRPFTVGDALAAGLSRWDVRRMLAAGDIRHVVTDAYIDSQTEETLDIRLQALSRVVPSSCVICDVTACWVHGVAVLADPDRVWVPPVQLFRTSGRDRLRRSGCVGGKRMINLRTDVDEMRDLLVTTRLRTALDLGRLRSRRDSFIALNALARSGGFGRSELRAELPRFRGMRGVVQLRDLVQHVDPRIESPGESTVLLQIIDSALPRPEPQWVVRSELGVEIYRLDFAYAEIKLAVEYDGEAFHSSPEQRDRDRTRRDYLRGRGWTFVVLRKEHVFGTSPQTVALVRRGIDRALALRAG
jgi:REase_MTES_1575